ncbi:hypothetical protein L917_20021 [Phytophthora nicotianae]|uniref:Uncharacterized protein n=2 Tax=Phytophthora nicotianae TaxID=4792 RepID=W2HW11_PHYNI|nr:hypothetical protein L915_20284 [Phytophthora nicotianae]ETL26120.1 hypothetical protein L916_20152 [Phytophthora nicotianae]ETL79329.1 hypothetical protein L917_20021 [Phytophthora nicotianae]ETO61026.1 hypothetical protein F444_20891 [Phytophthora nicotianae P1976]
MRTSPICQSAKENTAYWFTLAGINYQARLQSEETNRASKAIMATHVQLNDTLREVVQIQTSYQEKDVLRSEMPLTPHCHSTTYPTDCSHSKESTTVILQLYTAQILPRP